MPPKTKIFVGSLPPTAKEFELRRLFERIGEVTECSILGNYAFIHMGSEEEATEAIKKLDNWDMNGFNISVQQSTGGFLRRILNPNEKSSLLGLG